jgi:ArsR family transcriptional regulator, virulence genes transcriptional regulator
MNIGANQQIRMPTFGPALAGIAQMNEPQINAEPEESSDLTELHEMASHACELLKAMSNEWRLMILCQLAEGEKTVGELQSLLGLSQSAMSQHLAILRREKIVQSRKHAQSVSYSLAGDEATMVMATLHDVFCGKTGAKK